MMTPQLPATHDRFAIDRTKSFIGRKYPVEIVLKFASKQALPCRKWCRRPKSGRQVRLLTKYGSGHCDGFPATEPSRLIGEHESGRPPRRPGRALREVRIPHPRARAERKQKGPL